IEAFQVAVVRQGMRSDVANNAGSFKSLARCGHEARLVLIGRPLGYGPPPLTPGRDKHDFRPVGAIGSPGKCAILLLVVAGWPAEVCFCKETSVHDRPPSVKVKE